MRKQFSVLLLVGVALLYGCGNAVEQPDAAASKPKKPKKPFPIARVASHVADRLPHAHITRQAFDDTIATNALMGFVDSLDYDHSYFMVPDIEAFKAQATLLDDQIKDGEADFARQVFAVFRERVNNRTAYVNRLLDAEFDLTAEETYRWKRDEEPWPADEAEWNELWRKKVKNELVSRVAALETEPEEDDEEVSTNEVVEAEILSPVEFVRERYKQYQLQIENNFDDEAVLQRYLNAFARSYDPHTEYLSPRGVEDFEIHMSLSLVGIGAMLRSEDGAAKITSLIAGGPAEADGRLKSGDKIIAVAQGDEEAESILHWPLSRAVRLIRGKKGTQVVLTVIPAEDTTGTRTKKIDLIRDEVKLEEQAAKSKLHDLEAEHGGVRIGQIILPEFYADFEKAHNGDHDARRCSVDVRRILEEFATNDVDGVILDLRNDGGGSLTEAIDLTGFFISLGPVVQVRDRYRISVLPDGDPAVIYRGPLIVLVNRLSASASEIVAAALQDYGRAVIVGDHKTHGKGTVQSVQPLSKLSDNLGSIKVTTATFYRIAGGSTQLRGVTPDIVLPSLFDTLEIGEEFLDNALPWRQERSAYYRPWRPSVKPMIPELQTRSKERIAADPVFQAFLAKRERIRERMETPEVSLTLSDRVDEIIAEQELEDLQDEVLPPDDTEDEEEREDPVLDETLRILADMIELQSGELLTRNP